MPTPEPVAPAIPWPTDLTASTYPDPGHTITGDTVTMPRAEYDRITAWAACWELWWTPAAIRYRADETERRFQTRDRQVSWDVCAAWDWGDPTNVPIGYLELRRRRYPWVHDPDWRCEHHQPNGRCQPCALPAPRFRKDHAA